MSERRANRHARKLNSSERAAVAATQRLLKNADWRKLTAAANASSNNPSNLDRWRKQVREVNPDLDDAQVDILAERKRSEYYAELGRRSGAARRERVA